MNSSQDELYNYTFYMIHRKGLTTIDIYDEENGEHYIGSTRHFKSRCSKHMDCCNNINNKDYNTPVYQHLRLNGGFAEWIISVIETHDNITKKNALIHERWLQELYSSQLNKWRPLVTQEEKKEKQKIWRKNNRDKNNAKAKRYYERNTDRCKEIARKSHHKNRDKRLEYSRQYWINKKDEIDERKSRNRDRINECQRIRRAKKKLEKEQSSNP